jgi:hypothetical protein
MSPAAKKEKMVVLRVSFLVVSPTAVAKFAAELRRFMHLEQDEERDGEKTACPNAIICDGSNKSGFAERRSADHAKGVRSLIAQRPADTMMQRAITL